MLEKLAIILGMTPKALESFQGVLFESIGKNEILEKIWDQNERIIKDTLIKINSREADSGAHVRSALQKSIFYQEKKFLEFLNKTQGQNEFEKAAYWAKRIAKANNGLFLKKDLIPQIFTQSEPNGLLDYLGYSSVEELLEKEDAIEAFSALRFVESNQWMHQTFEKAYSNLKEEDFEEREIEIKVLSPRWYDIAKKFVEKKHHNVSHLKEFGVIFLNPIKMDIPGKFLRDFALLLHYFHEIEFYSKLFKKYLSRPDFNQLFKALLRGDVKDVMESGQKNAWLIVQRYLVKEDPQDPRLLMPRINPESIHWAKGERDLAELDRISQSGTGLEMWFNLDWVAGIFYNQRGEEIVSFDLEDNAMSLVSLMEGKNEAFNYHQREAMWTKIFAEYAGGEEKLEELILDNFEKGYITL